MPVYADIYQGECVNVIIADEDFREPFAEAFADHDMVGPLDDLDPQPGIGWSYDGKTWTPPPEPEAPQEQPAP